ncbi:SDR family oxidoreductase [Sphingobium sp. CR2-8]|uniref:NAD-dependent epimerase/dehydratase family protein n=1 Tax=Sphingobium sp. CR2-8 TaxID=1306534 RepID=UPI002DB66313|nr:SDR family oxidoreductase [Sphingobium sp. CR2-8]MEC3912784.1 SDR family oxidoreductase [Sphingobium sp. CR2-8]
MKPDQHMKIFIIGSHGFVGSHLVRHLSETATLYTADIVESDSPLYTRLPLGNPDLTTVIAAIQPDVVINCAGAADVGLSFKRPDNDYALNVGLVQNILEGLRTQAPTAQFINMSSAAVYGNPQCDPVCESATLTPISPYGWHKLTAENLCREYAECFGLQTISLRLFSVFGPGLRKQLYWDIFQKTLTLSHIECPGTGDETRDYIFVKDVCRAVSACIDHADFRGDAINVANGQAVPVKLAISTLLQQLKWPGQLTFNGVNRVGDPLRWRADISRLTAMGYQPSYAFEDGVSELVRWFSTQR